MRVALAGHYPLDPNKISGGPQAVFAYLVEGLRQVEGLDLHVVSAHKQITETTRFQRDKVTFHFLPHPVNKNLGILQRLINFINGIPSYQLSK